MRNERNQSTVNRDARDKLVDIINRYLNEQTSAFQFDEEMFQLQRELGKNSEDRTVEYVIRLLWYFYDDIKDHPIDANKTQWDFFQRLILLLKSDAHLETLRERRWSFRQLVAALILALCILAIWPFGIGEHIYLLMIPCGVASLSLTAFWKCEPSPGSAVARVPFNSFAQIRSVRRTVPDFVKQKYPKHLTSRTGSTLSRLANVEIPPWPFQFIFSPIVLFFQMFPKSHSESSVLTATDP